MSDTPLSGVADLAPELARRLNEACNRFEAPWRQGDRPRLDDFLAAADGELAPILLTELVHLDIYYRRQHGERPRAEEYLERFPALAPDRLTEALTDPDAGRPAERRRSSDTVAPQEQPTEPAAPVLPTAAFGGYELLGEIARGGMGVVYRARQARPARLVALKLILAGAHADPDRRARLLAEADAIARLQHPNIVQVYEVGEHDGLPFLALEYVEGGSLAQRLGTAPLEPRPAAGLLLPLARAAHVAHERGVVHRDLKPANVLLAADGTPKITDFGLAKQEGAGLTATGAVLGTPGYMAPEQAAGKGKEVGPPADVWALGAILYECLTGRPPFMAATALDTLAQVLSEDPVPPRRLNPAVPRDLETVCLKCLHKEPERRYASALDLAEDLRRFLDGVPILARRSRSAERLWAWCRRNPFLAIATASAALLLVAVTVVSAVSAVWLKGERDEAAKARRQAETAERQAHLQEAEALVGQAHGTRLSRRPGQRFEALEALGKAAAIGRELGQPPGWFDRLRNEAIAALALPDVHITTAIPGAFPSGTVAADVSDDFELYARTTDTGGCTVRRVADGTEVACLPELGERAIALFGPGRLLAVRGGKSFQLWDLSGTQPALRLQDGGVTSCHFRPDGQRLGLVHGEASVSLYDVATATRLARLAPAGVARGVRIWLHPTEPVVAVSSYLYTQVEVRDWHTGAVVAEARPPWRGNGGVAWSPDGRTLSVSDGDNVKIQQYAFDPAAPALRPTRFLQGRDPGDVTYNPAGDRIVRRGWGRVVELFDAVSGRLLFTTHPLPPAPAGALKFDRTGRRLAGARVGEQDDQLGLWSVADGREYRYLVHAERGAANHLDVDGPSVAIHPGGRLAAVGLRDGVTLFDLETGNELVRRPVGGEGEHSVCFDRTGNLLANGAEGFLRWPVRPDPADPGRLTVGPPQRLPFHPGVRMVSASQDGRVLAQCMWQGYGEEAFAGGWILRPNSPAPRQVVAGRSVGSCSVSPDGRWVAFGALGSLEVFDAGSGQRVWQAAAGSGPPAARFSPDGRWLVTNADGGRLYAAGSWEPGPRLGPGTPWDVTTDLAVLGQPNGIYRLVELTTGRELARLEDPEQSTGRFALTADGTKLVVAVPDGLRVWDLRRLRTELAKLDLDWDAPPLPAAASGPLPDVEVDLGATASFSPPPQETPVQRAARCTAILKADPDDVEAYHERGHAYEALGRWEEAAAVFTEALKRRPDDAHFLAQRGYDRAALTEYGPAAADLERSLQLQPDAAASNCLARLHARGLAPGSDPRRALALAERAVQLAPQQADYRGTLGMAYYANGRYREAVAPLEESLKGPSAGLYLLYLGMCHHHLGDAAKAKECFDRAVRWAAERKLSPKAAELFREYRAAAEKALGARP